MSNPLTAQYFDSGGRVAFMACAMFALGLIVGALIMDWAHERKRRAARKPRPARVRPPKPPEPVGRHRDIPGTALRPIQGPAGVTGEVMCRVEPTTRRGRIDVRA